jgi:hypothetical protein
MAGMAGQLQGHMAGLSQEQRNNALATIFGSDAVRAANVLYKEGATGISEWTRKTNDAGYAAKQAAALQDNLAGDLEKLGGSFDTLMVSIGHGVQGPLRGLTELVTGLLNGAGSLVGVFANLPGPVQAAVFGFAAWAAAGERVTGMFGKARDAMRAFTETQELQRALLSSQNSTLSDTERALGGLGSELENTSGKFGLTKAAIGSFAKAIGPELGVAAAVYGISSVASSLDGIMHAGDSARAEVRDLNRSLGDIDSNDARIDAVAHSITDLTHKLADAKAIAGNSDDLVGGLGNPLALGEAIAKYKDAGSSVDIYKKALADLEGQQQRAKDATAGLSAQYGITATDVVNLADKYGINLTAGMDSVNRVFVNSGAAAEVASGAVTSVGNAAGMTQAQIESATKAQEDWLTQLQQVATGFVDPLAAYQGLLQAKQEAEQASAQATADSTTSSKDSWKDYVKEASVSLDEYAQKLQDQITAQQNWQDNIVTITQVAGLGVGQQLAAMGIEGAGLVQKMVDAIGTDQFPRLVSLMTQEAGLAGDGAAGALDTKMKVMAAVAAAGGKATVQSIATELGIGVGTVADIFAQYSNSVAGGVNPLLLALGKPTLAGYHVAGINGGPGGTLTKASGGYISGPGSGTSDSIPARLSNGEFVVRASATAKHLPLLHALNSDMLPGYAGGGYVTAADVPKPYSTGRYSGAISAPGAAGMSKEYDEAVAFMNATAIAGSPGAPAGAGVQRWLPTVLAALNLMGQPASLAQTTLRRMQQESGGNPTAVNRTDVNWQRGTPSVGLMQVIGPTYRAYKDSRHDVGPYMYGTSTEGMSNILGLDALCPRQVWIPFRRLQQGGRLRGRWRDSGGRSVLGGRAGAGTHVVEPPEVRVDGGAVAGVLRWQWRVGRLERWVGERRRQRPGVHREPRDHRHCPRRGRGRRRRGRDDSQSRLPEGGGALMATITMVTTPQPSNVPPRVKIDITDTGTPAINSVTVTRLDIDGDTSTVRTSDGLALPLVGTTTRTATVYDYEMPLGSSVTYSTVEKPAVTSTTLIDSSVVWLVHPGVPALSMPVDFRIHSFESEELAVKAGVFYPMGRRNAVSVTDGRRRGATGSFTVGLDTLSDLTSLRALLDDASVLLLNVPASFNLGLDSRYLAIQDVTIKRRSDVGSDPGRDVVMPYVTVDSPVGGSQSQWAWSNVISQYATWTALIAAEPTWTDVFSPTN